MTSAGVVTLACASQVTTTDLGTSFNTNMQESMDVDVLINEANLHAACTVIYTAFDEQFRVYVDSITLHHRLSCVQHLYIAAL